MPIHGVHVFYRLSSNSNVIATEFKQVRFVSNRVHFMTEPVQDLNLHHFKVFSRPTVRHVQFMGTWLHGVPGAMP